MHTQEDYIWADTSDQTLEYWLAESKPHELEGDDDHPWLCVTRNWWPAVDEDDEEEIAQRDKALRSGRSVLKHLGNRLKEVKNEKEPALKRKLEQGHFQKLAKENMTSIAFKYHHSVGYWSLTRKADKGRSGVVTGKKLDHLFEQLAFSLIEEGGALEATPAKMVAISLAPKDGKEAHQHEIRIYMKNIFMESHAKQVLQALILYHGVVHAWAKSDMYEELHLLNIKKKDRIIPETVWMPEDLFTKDEIEEMKKACRGRKKEEKESGGGALDRSTRSVKRKQKGVFARGSKPWDQSDSDGEEEEDELESESEDQHVSTPGPPPRKKAKKGDGQVQSPLSVVRSPETVEIEDSGDDEVPGAGGGADDGVRIEELLDEVMGDGLVDGEVDDDDEGEEEIEWADSD